MNKEENERLARAEDECNALKEQLRRKNENIEELITQRRIDEDHRAAAEGKVRGIFKIVNSVYEDEVKFVKAACLNSAGEADVVLFYLKNFKSNFESALRRE